MQSRVVASNDNNNQKPRNSKTLKRRRHRNGVATETPQAFKPRSEKRRSHRNVNGIALNEVKHRNRAARNGEAIETRSENGEALNEVKRRRHRNWRSP